MTNSKNILNIFENLGRVLGSQLIVLVCGLVKVLIIPLFLNITDYGYWQLYVFYVSYVGLLTFGYNDGIYLNFGGQKLNKIMSKQLRGSNILYLFLILVGVFATITLASLFEDSDKYTVFLAVAVNVAIMGIISNISMTLQASSRFKDFSFINSADKLFFTFSLLALIKPPLQSFEFLIIADIFAKCLLLVVIMAKHWRLFFGSISYLKTSYYQFHLNIKTGMLLLIANLSSMLILGVGRIIVEYYGSMEDYAYYAFGSTMSAVILVGVTGISIVLYPNIKRLPSEGYRYYFDNIQELYSVLLVIIIATYFIATSFINLIAIEYLPVLEYLNVLFAIIALQGKMQILISTFYKAFRLERRLLTANLSSLTIIGITSLVIFLISNSVTMLAYTILIVMCLRVFASEIYLYYYLRKNLDMKIFTDLAIVLTFLIITSVFPLGYDFITWVLVSSIFAYKQREKLAIITRRVADMKS